MARIAVGGWQHETNTFALEKATLDAFLEADAWPGLIEGSDLLDVTKGMNIPISGFVDAATRCGHEPVPLLWASATPSGPVTDDAFEEIAARLVARLAQAAPFDAVYLDLHGAMVTETLDDGEGEILRRVRAQIGTRVPVVASLDFHANVSDAMVAQSDALVGYRTYPHIDMAATGARAAGLIEHLLRGERLAKMHCRLPFLVPLTWQCTLEEPMAELMSLATTLESDGVATLSFLPGFPLADAACSAPSIVGYGSEPHRLAAAVKQMEAAILAAQSKLSGRLYTPAEAIEEVRQLLSRSRRGPIVLADTQDNPGAGGTADTVGLLSALLDARLPAAVGVICDPEAARAAHAAGRGATIMVPVGARSGFAGERPIETEWIVESIGSGSFVGTGPFYQGCRFALGPMAALRARDVQVVVSTRRQQAADKSMFRHVGIEPSHVPVIALKSSVHFRADFSQNASAVLVVVSPGANTADLRQLHYRRLPAGTRVAP